MTDRSEASQWRQLVELARQMIAGDRDILEGTRYMDRLATRLGKGLDEPFLVFKGIASQIDHLPHPASRHLYEASALRRADEEIEQCRALFTASILAACTQVVERFSELGEDEPGR